MAKFITTGMAQVVIIGMVEVVTLVMAETAKTLHVNELVAEVGYLRDG